MPAEGGGCLAMVVAEPAAESGSEEEASKVAAPQGADDDDDDASPTSSDRARAHKGRRGGHATKARVPAALPDARSPAAEQRERLRHLCAVDADEHFELDEAGTPLTQKTLEL